MGVHGGGSLRVDGTSRPPPSEGGERERKAPAGIRGPPDGEGWEPNGTALKCMGHLVSELGTRNASDAFLALVYALHYLRYHHRRGKKGLTATEGQGPHTPDHLIDSLEACARGGRGGGGRGRGVGVHGRKPLSRESQRDSVVVRRELEQVQRGEDEGGA